MKETVNECKKVSVSRERDDGGEGMKGIWRQRDTFGTAESRLRDSNPRATLATHLQVSRYPGPSLAVQVWSNIRD